MLQGCGRMGSALLAGWLERGIPPEALWVIEPNPSDWLRERVPHINAPLPSAPAIALISVKPQAMKAALPQLRDLGGGATLFVSVAAGTPLHVLEVALGKGTPVVRAMPNTPAAVGKGITAVVGNRNCGARDLAIAEALLSAVGQVVRLQGEAQMDAVTALSGSGPAYVFHLIECMAASGVAQGLSEDLAMKLATATVAGAGALAAEAGDSPGELRSDVTSPQGTTAAALEVLMDADVGLPPLIDKAVTAAVKRSRELSCV